MKATVKPNVNLPLGIILKGLVKKLEDLEIRGQVKTIQTTAVLRSTRILRRVPRDLRRLVVTKVPVTDYQLTLVRKTLKCVR